MRERSQHTGITLSIIGHNSRVPV